MTPRVLIGVPAFDICYTDFAMSLASMMGHITADKANRREFKVSIVSPRSTIIPHARNSIVADALRIDATHILFLDSDQTFPVDTLNRLMSHNVDVVGADYVSRAPPFTLNGKVNNFHPASKSQDPRALIPMLTLPFGCILIRTAVFRAIPAPHFIYIEGGVNPTDTLSEDTHFCNLLRRHDHTIWMDPQLTREVGHIGTHVYRPQGHGPALQGTST